MHYECGDIPDAISTDDDDDDDDDQDDDEDDDDDDGFSHAAVLELPPSFFHCVFTANGYCFNDGLRNMRLIFSYTAKLLMQLSGVSTTF